MHMSGFVISRPGCPRSGEKVREKRKISRSGDFEIGLRNLKMKQKGREKSGNFDFNKSLNELNIKELRLRQFLYVWLVSEQL